jgi:Mg-chelatase subunit ChlD
MMSQSASTEPMNSTSEALIDSITCPITGEVMKDPVQGNDGHTYERTAIIEWLSRNPISPQTRAAMQPSDLKMNANIRFLCDKYHDGSLSGSTAVPHVAPKISTDQIKLDHSVLTNGKDKIMLSFDVNETSFPHIECGHLPQDVVLVIDHSASMGTDVEAKDGDGNKLENGFSIQDIVNHAAKTVAKTLDNNSRLAIIAFDNVITVTFDLMLMSGMNQSQALAKISTIVPAGQTNIYGAIEKALEILDVRTDKTRNSAILMLTDGQPNISPARGEVETLRKLREKKNFTTPIYTFGFGCNLRRELLYDIAKYANGANGHIPDGGMIATVFCNFIATVMSTVVMNLQLHIHTSCLKLETGSTGTIRLMGDYASHYEGQSLVYDLGTVQRQQSRDIIVDSVSAPLTYFYTYKIGGASYKTESTTVKVADLTTSPSVNIQTNRYELVESMRKMINYSRCQDWVGAKSVYNAIDNRLIASKSTDKLTQGMIKNLRGDGSAEGQIKLAISMAYFHRWGEFYIDQLSRSMNQQIKPNFKDEGCPFGGDVFEEIVDRASDIFDTLPPPEPSNKSRSGGGISAPPRAPVSLANYNDMGGGCIVGSSQIQLADGTFKKIEDLTKGDNVVSLSDAYDINSMKISASVVCILKTTINGKTSIVSLADGLKITPWHPIMYHGTWKFPYDLGKAVIKDEACGAVYSILLDQGHTTRVNGVWCIGLGHSFTSGILHHPYFGTSAVIEDLKKLQGWENGLVTIDSSYISRDSLSREISGIVTPLPTKFNNLAVGVPVMIYDQLLQM